MRELYKTEDGTSVFDLDITDDTNQAAYTKSPTEEKFLRDVGEFSNAGFRIASKESFPTSDGPGRNVDYDMYSPEAILVANGSDTDAAVEHGMIFLHAGIEDKEGAFLYLALDGSAKGDVLEETAHSTYSFKGDPNGVFFETEDGDLFGYMRIARDASAGLGKEYDNALQNLRELDLPTIPMPMERSVVEMIPHFQKEELSPEDLTMEEIAEVLGEHFRERVDAFEMPGELMGIALAANPNAPPPREIRNTELNRSLKESMRRRLG
ncbi:hypothetical protein [Alteromonas sp. 14N.309.X.WAT.G.H12]|uniref:hypothetical protein n=1 Tax=Alteromonas sp. 14N.309.X.WAT.G.H12 TaxID=3120824 RepID=UPI002FCF1FA7